MVMEMHAGPATLAVVRRPPTPHRLSRAGQRITVATALHRSCVRTVRRLPTW
jgi:hypothetical protein